MTGRSHLVISVILFNPGFLWRQENSRSEGDFDVNFYIDLVRTAERGKLDAFFLGDKTAVRDDGVGLEGLQGSSGTAMLEPLTLLAALSSVTKNIGLFSTVSTTYNHPYHTARMIASLDHLSHGRAGWNLVTSNFDADAKNFGLSGQLPNAERYERAREFLDVVCGLWDTWDDDAFVRNRSTGQYYDPKKVRYLNHKGKHFNVRGPLNIARPVQGHPIICQAGFSEAGYELAAETADIMYVKTPTLEIAKQFYKDVKSRLPKYGREPEELVILPGICPVVGNTEEEAWAKLQKLLDPLKREDGLGFLKQHTGGSIDFSRFAFDEPIPDTSAINEVALAKRMFLERDGHRLTPRELMYTYLPSFGHFVLIGTPDKIADTMVQWMNEQAADGFSIQPYSLPECLDDFVDYIVPELQKRGVFKAEYAGLPVRDALGLPRPINRHFAASALHTIE